MTETTVQLNEYVIGVNSLRMNVRALLLIKLKFGQRVEKPIKTMVENLHSI